MSGSSDVRLNTERLEAAERKLDELVPCAVWWFNEEDRREDLALVLAAADAAGSWNDTERLRTALTDLLAANEQHHNAPPDWTRLDVALDAARAALAESVPSPPAKAAR